MIKLKYKIIFYLLLIIRVVTAQNNTQSPYSKLGLGDFQSISFGKSASMGGVGYALFSTSEVNHANPASLANLDSLLSVFEFGLHAGYTQIKNKQISDTRSTANISNISYGMAINNRWGLSFGMSPYTNVGYKIIVDQQISGVPQSYSMLLEGSGGLSKLFWATGYQLSQHISLGLNVSFLFGPKNEDQYYYIENISNYTITRKLSDKYNGWNFDFGYQQTIPLANGSNIGIGLKVNAPGKLKRKSSELLIQNNGANDTLVNTEDIKLSVDLPAIFGGGLSYQFKNQLTLAADYTINRFSKMLLHDNYSELIDNQVYAFGVEYKPKRNRTYNHNLYYRIGWNYQTGFYAVEGNKLKSMIITAGLGFNINSIQFNVFGSYGGRGFLDQNLIKENSAIFGINMAFHDSWFHKRKFK